MIDTHAHLAKILPETRGKVKWIILAAASRKESFRNLELAQKYDFLIPAVGIHPMSPFEKIDDLIKKAKAIGECGLDYANGINPSQTKLFKTQIELAKKYNLPLIIHARKAVDETIEILKNYSNLRGVFHCYAGGRKRIKNILALGDNWYFGIDGNLTYEIGLEQVVLNIAKDRLILETDCPWLAPVPHRGEENKPAYVKYVYQKVAEIWQMSFEETEKIIDGNAKKLFSIP